MPRIALCSLKELPIGLGRGFEVGETSIAVFRTRGDEVFATESHCPHKGGPLADGMLAGDQVVCPYHAFKFQRRSGECDQPGVCSIATYPVTVEDDEVYVTL